MDTRASQALKQKAEQLNRNAKALWRFMPHEAIDKTAEAERIANDVSFGRNKYVPGIIESRTIQTHALVELAELDEGLRVGISAEALAERHGDPTLHASALGALARAYLRMTNYPKALECVQRQLLIARENKDDENVLWATFGLSAIYKESGEYASAIEYAEHSLQLLEQTEHSDALMLCGCYNNLCVVYGNMGQPEKGLQYGLAGLELAQTVSNSTYIALLLAVATSYRHLEQFDLALRYYHQGLDELAVTPNPYFHAITVFDIANTFFHMQSYAAAQTHVEQALTLSTNCNSLSHQSQCHELLSKLARERGDFETALTHYQLFHSIQNNVIGEQNVKQMRMLRASYEIDMAQLEAELYRLKTEELELQVDRRTQDLKQALQRERVLGGELAEALAVAKEASKLRSRIIETVSHEFRTPLTVINASVDLLVTFSDALSPSKRETLQGRIREAILHITDLLQDVGMVDSADASTITPSYHASTYEELCARIAQKIAQEMNETERIVVTSSGEPEAIISTDENLLRQILYNLLSNALKYSPSGSPVRLHTTIQNNWMTIQVVDEGVGILSQEIESIFGLMQRGSNIETQRGLGLGLYIARSIAHVFGGALSAESPGPNQGATFTLRIPCSKPLQSIDNALT